MGIFKLCQGDEILSTLKKTFNANPIKVPEERIKPLTVFSEHNKDYKYIGDIRNLLTDASKLGVLPENSKMADLSGTKSKSIDSKIGIQILNGFLEGFGASGASLENSFSRVKKISFSFKNINRNFIDIGELCKVLEKRKFDISHPVNKNFLDETSQCIIIDSIITSDNFSIKVEETKDVNFKLDIPEIEGFLESQGNKVSATSSNDLEISFKGDTTLAFAFSCFIIKCDLDGSIYYSGEDDKMHLTALPNQLIDEIAPLYDPLDSEFGMLELNNN